MLRLILLCVMLPVVLSAQNRFDNRPFFPGIPAGATLSESRQAAAPVSDSPFMVPDGKESDPGTAGRFGLRAGVGTDIGGGLAYGIGLNYLLPMQTSGLEIGVLFYGGSFEETTEEYYTYHETTDIMVFALMSNFLLGSRPDQSGLFFVGGIGLGMIDVEWEEWSPDDTSLGPPLPDGGSRQSADGSGGGMIFNVGGGYNFSSHVDLRFEIPVFLTFEAPEKASAVIPTFTCSLGYRF